jgi:type I restriction enzyme S subunit
VTSEGDLTARRTIRLGDVCEKIGSGATPRGGADVYVASGVALIRSQNVHNNFFTREGLAYITERHAGELANVDLKPDDVLLNITGDSVARCTQVPASALPARVNQHVAIIRPATDQLDPGFLRYFLTSPAMQAHMLQLAGAGATRNALTKAMIENFRVPALEIGEQRCIAETLGTLDEKIELNRRMNETLEAITRTIFNSTFEDVELEGPITTIVDVISGGTPSTERADYWNGDISWASAKDVSQCGEPFLIRTERSITTAGLSESATTLVEPLTSVVVARGATTGRMAMFGSAMAMNQTCYGLRASDGDHYFVYCLLRDQMDGIVHAAHGSVFDTITTATLKSSRVPLPDRADRIRFHEVTEPLFTCILANEKESTTLASLRDTLLPKLLSGEIRVSAFENEVAEVV